MEELILKEREFKEKVVQLINESELPAFILRACIKEVSSQISILEQQQYTQALKHSQEKQQEARNEKS